MLQPRAYEGRFPIARRRRLSITPSVPLGFSDGSVRFGTDSAMTPLMGRKAGTDAHHITFTIEAELDRIACQALNTADGGEVRFGRRREPR